MCKRFLYLVSFIMVLCFVVSGYSDELIASYEEGEMDDLTFVANADGGLTVTRVKGGVDGAPPAIDGEYILKWVWIGETDRKIQVHHSWNTRRLDLAPYNVITAHVWFDGQSALPATIGIWDDVFGWAEALSVPIGTGQWHTVDMDISNMDQGDIDHIYAFLFEGLSGDDGVIYTDNMRLRFREQVQAWIPIPFDKAVSVDPNVELTWNAGIRASSHDVYFGTDYNDVNDATTETEGIYRGNQALDNTSYDPGTLKPITTYYWRIDEVNDADSTVSKGDIWYFLTEPLEYVEIPLVSYEDSEAHYEVWSSAGVAGPDNSLTIEDKLVSGSTWEDIVVPEATDGSNVLGLNWTDEQDLEIEFGCTFENSLPPFRYDLAGFDEMVFDIYYTDGSPLPHVMGAFDWRYRPAFNGSSNLPTTTGQWYTIVIDVSHLNNTNMDSILDFMFQFHGEDFDPDPDNPDNWAAVVFMDNLRLRYAVSRNATLPTPSNGATDIYRSANMSWQTGFYATSHNVYMGTNYNDVNDANTLDPVFKGNQPLVDNYYDSPGNLEMNTTYYWRVDEINDTHPDSPWRGDVWSFTTANFLVIDDFESYNDIPAEEEGSNLVYETWLDGFANPTTNGSVIGYTIPFEPTMETVIVHGGSQSMPFEYNNAVGKSEATLTLTDTRDWTENGVDRLIIWYIGDAANAAEPMYVVLNGTAVVTNDNPNAAQNTAWTEWNIDLQTFGINLTNVNAITLGFGNRTNPVAGGSGMVFFDDIRLYAPAP